MVQQVAKPCGPAWKIESTMKKMKNLEACAWKPTKKYLRGRVDARIPLILMLH